MTGAVYSSVFPANSESEFTATTLNPEIARPCEDGAKPRIGLLVTGYGLWNSLSLINAARILAERGYEVDIFTDTPENTGFVNPNGLPIRVYTIGLADSDSKSASTEGETAAVRAPKRRRRLRRLLPPGLDRALLAIWITGPRLLSFIMGVRRVIGHRPYHCFIGAETTGLAAASVLGKLRNIPVVYWSLELWLWSETPTLYYRLLKLLEFTFHRSAAFTIIPSESWISFLSRENGVPPSAFVVVPATARGPAYRQRSTYLQERLGIEPGRKVVLYAGSLVPWAFTQELVAAAHAWPAEWVLVIHGWGSPEYIERVMGAAPAGDRVRFSLDVVPLERLDELISSADVGLALYRDDNMARHLISSASSKIGQYVKCGLPVVTNESDWFQRLFAEYRCGVSVSEPGQVRAAVQSILEDHAAFRAAAVRCFEEKYDFDVHFAAVIHRLDALRDRDFARDDGAFTPARHTSL